jgi:hypothetical protein
MPIMAEEQFVQMYVRDFTTLASRAESGIDVEGQVRKRILETRSHAELMDARKSGGHLAAVSERLRAESRRDASQAVRTAADPVGAAARRKAFLLRVADLLEGVTA